MNTNYISRALCFHGQPMQKIWDDERGAGDIQRCGVPAHPDYTIYQERQKHFTFQDRAKRLKLHQFFARKATDLYDSELTSTVVEPNKIIENEQYIASLPPYELFVNRNKDKQKRCRCILKNINSGDIIYCMATKPTTNMVKPLCTGEPMVRYLNDLPIKAYLTKSELDGNGKPRVFNKNDIVRCEVLEISVDAERIYLTLESMNEKNKNITLGVITYEELPKYYRNIDENKLEKFEDYMLKSKEFLNPNYDMLYEINGLDVNETYTFMTSLKHQFPRDEYAKELRRTQASKWAFRSVAEGIEHFKNGNHVEAFQCLNKALTIDPRNVEGLVARGALYANKGSFLKAVDDFEKALKLNTYHVNARKYMGETLVALGRRYEDENRIKDATKAYQDCLNIIPNHEQARLSLEAIQQRTGSQYFENLTQLQGEEEDTLEREKMSVPNSSSDDGTTSSDSGSETEHTDNEDNGKECSMSPLSKRMALHVASLQKEEQSKKQLNQPFYMTAYNLPPDIPDETNINEFRLDDDDTGSRVRKLLQEASKHKKEKKKIKKKKSKKTKKVSRKEKNATNILNKINFQEAYKAISSMNIENKLTENLQKYEKTIADIKKRQHELVQSIEAGMTERKRSETPPRAPSMRLPKHSTSNYPATSSYYASYPSTSAAAAAAAAASSSNERTKFSFQIKRPVKVDKFGLIRVATPLAQRSPSPRSRSHTRTPSRERRRYTRSRSRSRNRSRTRSRYRSRSCDRWSRRRSRSYSITHSGGRRRGSRSRRSSRTCSPYRRSRSRTPRRTRSRSRSHSRSRTVRRGREASYGRRDYPRIVSRGIRPSPPTRHVNPKPGKSWQRRGGSGATRGGAFGNRVWRREDAVEGRESNGRWLHDKYEGSSETSKVDDGPSIEEIDEIINRAQKERKQEIIQRDKDILKKPTGGQF